MVSLGALEIRKFISFFVTYVPVGLSGLAIKITLVFSEIRRTIPGMSYLKFLRGTNFTFAPSICDAISYIRKVGLAMITSSSLLRKARSVRTMISSEPLPIITLSGLILKRPAKALLRQK